MKRYGLLLLLILDSGLAWAEEHGHGAHGGIPTRTIFWQVFNLAVLFGALFFILKDGVKNFFAQRRSGFVAAAEKSQSIRQEAEKQFIDIQHKIENLENTRAESLARAEAEAADMRHQLVREANEMAVKIHQEAEITAKIEVQRAKQDLHEKFVKEAIQAARTVLTKDLGAQDHQRLQGDFAKNLQAVHP